MVWEQKTNGGGVGGGGYKHVILHMPAEAGSCERTSVRICKQLDRLHINPFTVPACKFPGWKTYGCACKQYIFRLLSVLSVLMKILSQASAKTTTTTKTLKDFNFPLLFVVFNDIMAMKGLNNSLVRGVSSRTKPGAFSRRNCHPSFMHLQTTVYEKPGWNDFKTLAYCLTAVAWCYCSLPNHSLLEIFDKVSVLSLVPLLFSKELFN